MKRKIIYILIFILLFWSKVALSQYNMYKALYIYNFTKKIDWPNDTINIEKQPFIISVWGKNCEITDYLKEFTQSKKVIDRQIIIQETEKLRDLLRAEVIYIPQKSYHSFRKVKKQFKDKIPLIICDKNGDLVDISFVETDEALLFEIKPRQIKNKRLKVSNALLKLGIIRDDEK